VWLPLLVWLPVPVEEGLFVLELLADGEDVCTATMTRG